MVLIIEDNKIDQLIARRVVEEAMDVVPYILENGAEASNWISNVSLGRELLILLDINMPEFNGFDFLESLKASRLSDNTDVKVFMLTSSLDPRDVEKAMSFDFVKTFISKPLKIDKLRALLVEHNVILPLEKQG